MKVELLRNDGVESEFLIKDDSNMEIRVLIKVFDENKEVAIKKDVSNNTDVKYSGDYIIGTIYESEKVIFEIIIPGGKEIIDMIDKSKFASDLLESYDKVTEAPEGERDKLFAKEFIKNSIGIIPNLPAYSSIFSDFYIEQIEKSLKKFGR